MKITDIKVYTVDCFRTNWVFVKIYTDDGVTGVGEGTLEYKEKAFLGALEHIREYLLGKDASNLILTALPVLLGVAVYGLVAIKLKAITRADCLLLPKGEKIANLLHL